MEKIRKNFGEVFTPPALALMIVNSLPEEAWEEGKTFIDPTCGSGNVLVSFAEHKKELGHTKILSTIYGVDIVEDNILECRARLLGLCGTNKENKRIVERNIVWHDSLTYDFEFSEIVE